MNGCWPVKTRIQFSCSGFLAGGRLALPANGHYHNHFVWNETYRDRSALPQLKKNLETQFENARRRSFSRSNWQDMFLSAPSGWPG